MKLELYDDVYQKFVEYVRQMHPPEDSAPPSENELTTRLNDIVQQYLEQEEIWGTGGWNFYICNKIRRCSGDINYMVAMSEPNQKNHRVKKATVFVMTLTCNLCPLPL